jgi:RNA polymerase sigma factor (sigma-70 family)
MRNEQAGFDELVTMYRDWYPGLVRYLQRILQDGSGLLAEDVAQDTFAILVRKWPETRTHPNPRAWLYTVARRLAIRKLRERSREFVIGDLPDTGSVGKEDPTDSHDQNADVREAIRKLSVRQREAIWLFYFNDFKQDEVATIMGIKRATVAVLLSQARSRLAGLLGWSPEEGQVQ